MAPSWIPFFKGMTTLTLRGRTRVAVQHADRRFLGITRHAHLKARSSFPWRGEPSQSTLAPGTNLIPRDVDLDSLQEFRRLVYICGQDELRMQNVELKSRGPDEATQGVGRWHRGQTLRRGGDPPARRGSGNPSPAIPRQIGYMRAGVVANTLFLLD
jgi:hypothetical protein